MVKDKQKTEQTTPEVEQKMYTEEQVQATVAKAIEDFKAEVEAFDAQNPTEQKYSMEEVKEFLRVKSEQIEADVRNSIKAPAGYFNIETVDQFAQSLRVSNLVKTHERDKSIRWFTDQLRAFVK